MDNIIYLIRHGQTIWNLQGKKQGHKDSPLTIKGIEQMKNIANEIKKIPNFNDYKIISSPLGRCKQSTSIICEEIKYPFENCIFEEKLKEHSFGLWEGKTENEIKSEFLEEFTKRRFQENHWDYVVPMGESYKILFNRVSQVIEKYKNQKIIFVCHEMVSKVIRGKLLKFNKEEIIKLKHPQDVIYQIKNNKLKMFIAGQRVVI